MRHIEAFEWEIAAHWSSLFCNDSNEDCGVNVRVIASQLRIYSSCTFFSILPFALTFSFLNYTYSWIPYQGKSPAELKIGNPFVTTDWKMCYFTFSRIEQIHDATAWASCETLSFSYNKVFLSLLELSHNLIWLHFLSQKDLFKQYKLSSITLIMGF